MNWSALPDDILALIATTGILSVQDLRSMRRACRGWLSALPATGAQWLTMSRTRLECGRVSASVWAISKAGELVPAQACLPAESSCWGSAWGLLSMRGLNNDLFRHWPVGGIRQSLPPMPDGMEPQGFFHRPSPADDWPPWDMATLGIFGSRLHLKIPDGPWELSPMFYGIEMVRTADVTLDTFYAASYPDTLVMDFYLDIHRTISKVPLDGLKPWLKNGHHLFVLNDEMHLCILCHPEDDGKRTVALLFLITRLQFGAYELSRRHTIGNNSLFLGANQPIIFPSHHDFVGRIPDTIYVEHSDGDRRIPELLLIHLGTQDVNSIPFPPPLAEDIERFGPACWVHPWTALQ